jgi:hypothetical protein
MATTPYITPAEFAAQPTYLDLTGLRPNIPDPAAQTAELANILLEASSWADNQCNQVLAAHLVSRRTRARVNRDGNLVIPLTDTPFLGLQSLSYGTSFTAMSTDAAPSFRPDRVQTLLVAVKWALSIPGSWLYVDLAYTAGWVTTTVTTATSAGVSSLTVADSTGIAPATTYRLWEPGAEEAVTVAASYIPAPVTIPPTPATLPLAAPTVIAHTAGGGLSGMPTDMRDAIANRAISKLMRPDSTAEDSYPDTSLASGTRTSDPRKSSSGLVKDAVGILGSYARRV